jgi:RNA polymerase sigma-70 factor, ECF subfamily
MDDARDDGILLERVRQGDETAFSTLYERHQRAIYRYAMHMCGPGAADDVVQETFLVLIREGRGYRREKGTVAAYLFGIARHHVLKHCGLRIADCGLENTEVVSPQTSPLEDLQRSEATSLVREAIRTLPAAYREVGVLCELQEMDYADAAAVLECPIGTVRSRLHRARALLTQKLASRRETISVE